MIKPVTSPTLSEQTPISPERLELREAAQDFEALMVRQMLAAARATKFDEETPLTGGGMKQWMTMRDEQFADIAASQGAFGFARSIEEQLSQYVDAKGDE